MVNGETNLVSSKGFDSIDLMVMITNIEEEFNISFDVEGMEFENIILVNYLIHTIHVCVA